MKKIVTVIIILMTFNIIMSCGSSNNYLTQSYNSKPVAMRVNKIKTVLKKPTIIPDSINFNQNGEDILEKLESASFVSSLDVLVDNIIIEANSYLGTPYRYGGSSRRGIDCSAFMQKIFKIEGIKLPRVSYRQAKIGTPVSKGELQRGDLIFFSTTSPHRITHVGMVINVDDDIEFIHSSSSKGVGVSSLSDAYWRKRYRGARRPKRLQQEILIPMDEAEKYLASNR